MSSAASSPPQQSFTHVVKGYWNDFRREARYSFESVIAELPSGAADAPLVRRLWYFARAMFYRLTPARRAVLLIALAFLVSCFFISGEAPDSGTAPRAVFAALCLLMLLGLELADRVALKRDLELARRIQSWLLPQTPPQIPGLEIAFASRPANTVAGDYYDVLSPPAGLPATLFVLADVAGKGIPAGLLTACFRSCLNTLAESIQDPGLLAERLRKFCFADSNGGRHFTTAFLARYDPGARNLSYVSAGHNPALLRRASGELTQLPATGVPFGAFRDATYEMANISIEPGDLLLVYSDGIIEASNEAGDEFTFDRLCAFTGRPLGSADNYQKQLFRFLDDFTGKAPQHDDMTCLIVQFSATQPA